MGSFCKHKTQFLFVEHFIIKNNKIASSNLLLYEAVVTALYITFYKYSIIIQIYFIVQLLPYCNELFTVSLLCLWLWMRCDCLFYWYRCYYESDCEKAEGPCWKKFSWGDSFSTMPQGFSTVPQTIKIIRFSSQVSIHVAATHQTS